MERIMGMQQTLPQVTQFVIKTPEEVISHQDDLRSFLTKIFPDKIFRLEATKEQKFSLIPIMADQVGKATLCRLPDRSLVAEIFEALNEFRISAPLWRA